MKPPAFFLHLLKHESMQIDKEQFNEALKVSFRILAGSAKSKATLKSKLIQKRYADQIIEAVLEYLEEKNYLNDREYAASLMRHFREVKPSGARRILFEMKRKGVPEPIAAELIEGCDPSEDVKLARELALTKAGQLMNRDDLGKAKKKIYDLLVSRGFDFGIARQTIEDEEIFKSA